MYIEKEKKKKHTKSNLKSTNHFIVQYFTIILLDNLTVIYLTDLSERIRLRKSLTPTVGKEGERAEETPSDTSS